ncbi:MAG: Lpg1974 family pore-forming outer membrane protein [Gammaproteobacteria bacterium]
MKTKLFLVWTALAFSATAMAGAPGNAMVAPKGTLLIAPSSTGIWSIGGEALYMQQGSEYRYGDIGQGTPDQQNLAAGGAWNWGGELDVTYLFPSSSRDVRFAYTYLGLSSTDSANAPGLITPFVFFAPLDANSAKAENDETLNQADLVFGQWMHIGNRVGLHPFGGLRYANLDADNTSSYYGSGTVSPASTNIVENDDNSSNLQGLGPRAGIDAMLYLGNNFSLVGTFAGALIVGNINSRFSYNSYDATTGAITGSFSTSNDIGIALVPELDANLGLDYHVPFNLKTSMDVQVGYQLVNYFNAENFDGNDTYQGNSVNASTNFNYQGVYVRVQVNVP